MGCRFVFLHLLAIVSTCRQLLLFSTTGRIAHTHTHSKQRAISYVYMRLRYERLVVIIMRLKVSINRW